MPRSRAQDNERALRERLDLLTKAARSELLRVLTLPDFVRARGPGDLPNHRNLGARSTPVERTITTKQGETLVEAGCCRSNSGFWPRKRRVIMTGRRSGRGR
jgi:hypothetical protein